MKVIFMIIIGYLRTIKCHNLEECSPGYYRCSGYDPWLADYVYSKCIREDLICDGNQDCYLNEDEENCRETTTKSELKTNEMLSRSTKSDSTPTTTKSQTFEDTPKFEIAFNHSSVKKSLGASSKTNLSESKSSLSENLSDDSSEFVEKSSDDPILTRHRTPILSDKSNINYVIEEFSKWLEDSNITEESTKDSNWTQHDTSPFPYESEEAPYLPDESQNFTIDHITSETTDDPLWMYESSLKTVDFTEIYEMVTDDTIAAIDYVPKPRTRIELVIAITITIIIIFFLVVCVIFQKKLSRNRKRQKLSIGRRTRNKYKVNGKFDV